MKLIDKKLSTFLKSNEKRTLLICGPWGVGKTFEINRCINNIKEFAEYKILNISLFGIESIAALNEKIMVELNNKCKYEKIFKKINSSVEFKFCGFSLSMPIFQIISKFIKPRQKKKENYLIIFDDIERKDNKLSVDQILGYIDSLSSLKIKTILIMNQEKLKDGISEFKGLKEKVIDDEIFIDKPSKEAIISIIGKDLSKFFTQNYCYIKNLRTLKKIKQIINELDDETKKNATLIFAIYLCALNHFDNCFDREALRKLLCSYYKIPSELSTTNTSSSGYIEILKAINNELASCSNDFECFIKCLSHKFIFENTQHVQINNLLQFILECMKSGDYQKINCYNFAIKERFSIEAFYE